MVGELVCGDAGGNLRIADFCQSRQIEFADGADSRCLPFGREPGRAGQIRDGIRRAEEFHPLVGGWQEATAPDVGTAHQVLLAGAQHDKGGQVLGLAAEPVGDPRAHRGPPVARGTGAEEELRRSVVEVLGLQGVDQGQVVHDACHVREDLGHPDSRLAVSTKVALRAEQLGPLLGELLHECEALAVQEGVRGRLAVEFPELGTPEPSLELAGSARHEQVYDTLGLGREMRPFGCQEALRNGVGRCMQPGRAEQVSERQTAQAHEALAEEVTPGGVQ